jgi:hypothetical protein
MSKLTKALTAAAGNAGGDNLYVEDVFSTYLYDGNSSTQSIDNGIDLDGEGGLTWLKVRDLADTHLLFDTERGSGPFIRSNGTNAEQTDAGFHISSFNSNGFSLQGAGNGSNNSSYKYASWTFRKAEKFFDVVTYTGTGSVQNISHNLGVAPAFIITKKTSGTSNWATNDPSQANPWSGALLLNSSNAFATASTVWNDTAPTDSVFTVGTSDATNVSGQTYVAYLFASDAGGFGDDGSESVIKCGSFTTDGSGLFSVTLGFEPQWILVKRTSGSGNWFLVDAMRGLTASGIDDALLLPNSSSAEIDSNWFDVTATGFNSTSSNPDYNSDYIYIAIRRPMKTPESGTEVFTPIAKNSTNPTTDWTVGFPADMFLEGFRTLAGVGQRINTRLTGGSPYLETWRTDAEFSGFGGGWDEQDSYSNATGGVTPLIGWFFKRATGFFDVVAYDGTGVSPMNVPHNLGVTPELIITKARTVGDTYGWWTYPLFVPDAYGNTGKVRLNDDTAYGSTGWTGPMATSTAITVPSPLFSNKSGGKYVAYLFASLDGISKLGMYTGTGSNVDVDCGFSAGARFILIKRSDSTGDWYVWDSERGIVAGNDPYLLLNTTAAEVTNTDYIDPLSSGFTVTSSAPAALNASGGSYIFLAIA